MKAYMVETSCNQLLLIDRFHYVYAHQDLFASCHNVAMSLYNITTHVPTYKATTLVLEWVCQGWKAVISTPRYTYVGCVSH